MLAFDLQCHSTYSDGALPPAEVMAIAKQGSGDRAVTLVDELIKADPRNWLHRALKAQVLAAEAQLDQALDVTKMAHPHQRRAR